MPADAFRHAGADFLHGISVEEANRKLCEMAKEQTTDTLNKVLLESSKSMKNGYNRADN